jgi:hypothetical protein
MNLNGEMINCHLIHDTSNQYTHVINDKIVSNDTVSITCTVIFIEGNSVLIRSNGGSVRSADSYTSST